MNPPLPNPQWLGDIHGYTEAQLLAYRDACIEMCADLCESHIRYPSSLYFADAIRSLK